MPRKHRKDTTKQQGPTSSIRAKRVTNLAEAHPDRDETLNVLFHSERWTVAHGDTPADAVDEGHPSAARHAWSQANAHNNTDLEILLAVRGDAWFGMNGTMHRCCPGCLFLIAPGVPHDSYYPANTAGLEHVWIRLLSDRVFVNWLAIDDGRMIRLHEPLAVLQQEQLGVLTAAFSTITHLSALDTVRLHLLIGMIASHLGEYMADPEAHEAVWTPQPESFQSNVAAAIRRHIDDTAGKGVTLEFLAHFSGYSKFHLSRIFREWSGCTVHQYIDKARRRKMKAMLADGARNADIAEALGFSETSAYLRWRRKLHT